MNIEQSKPRSLRPLLHRLSVACALALCAMAIPGVASADEGTLGGWDVSG